MSTRAYIFNRQVTPSDFAGKSESEAIGLAQQQHGDRIKVYPSGDTRIVRYVPEVKRFVVVWTYKEA